MRSVYCLRFGQGSQCVPPSASPILSFPWRPALPPLPFFEMSLPCALCVHLQADKSIRIWNMDTGKCVRKLSGHSSHVVSVAWIPGCHDRLISASWDETIKVWDLAQDTPSHTFVGHSGKVNCVCLSPDGDVVISGGEDKLVKLWRISNNECFLTLQGHRDEVLAVAISPDGTTFASASKDKTIRTYRTMTV